MFANLEQTIRWYGPPDLVSLAAIKQTGATGIVHALHHIPCGEVWLKEEIHLRKTMIEQAGFKWSVVESVNIHESIKLGLPERDFYIEHYIQTLNNLADAGINTVCYNFMPVLDWTRTDLNYHLSNGAVALKFYLPALIAFDLFILERENSADDYTDLQKKLAKIYFEKLDFEQKKSLQIPY